MWCSSSIHINVYLYFLVSASLSLFQNGLIVSVTPSILVSILAEWKTCHFTALYRFIFQPVVAKWHSSNDNVCKLFNGRCGIICFFFLLRVALKKCCQECGTPNPELSSFLENIRGAPPPMGWGDRRETGSSRLSMCLKIHVDRSLTCLSGWVTVCIISSNTTHDVECLWCAAKLLYNLSLQRKHSKATTHILLLSTFSGQAGEQSGEYTVISLTITMRPRDTTFWYFLSSTPSRLKALLLSPI